ncbi:hypothetical protein HMPREF0972_01515 [Actinomyces sp. oral taxon 848 str. F0332]|nr:hypothetical protein HMPREF0972_01515 [Actinomyces sp. oral taxon 848 str. F0332]
MKTVKGSRSVSQQPSRKFLIVKRFFRAFALVACIVASSTRSASPELAPLNTYRSDFASVSVGRHHLCLKTKGQEVYCFFPNLKKGNHRSLGNIVPLEPLDKRLKLFFTRITTSAQPTRLTLSSAAASTTGDSSAETRITITCPIFSHRRQ